MNPSKLTAYREAAAAAKARADNATPGPWRKCGGCKPTYQAVWSDSARQYIIFHMADSETDAESYGPITAPDADQQANNSRFIAGSITDIPTLATAVAALADEVEKLTPMANFAALMMEMVESHFTPDDLPKDDNGDYLINGWLRMRAARDEAIADKEREYARGRAAERRDVLACLRDKTKWKSFDDISVGKHVKEATDAK